ncbi:MAG: TolC family protein [Kiritimatiellia bacterium]|nr:TolC family protein [Kiritimatiellia bacterium]
MNAFNGHTIRGAGMWRWLAHIVGYCRRFQSPDGVVKGSKDMDGVAVWSRYNPVPVWFRGWRLVPSALALSVLGGSWLASAQKPRVPEPTVPTYSIEAAVNLALAQNPDVVAARQQLDAAAGVAMQSRAAVRPKVRAQSTYGIQDRELIETFTDTVQDQNWGASLRVVQPLYEGGRLRSSLATARLLDTQATQAYQQVAARVVRDVYLAYYDTVLAQIEIAVQEASVQLLEKERTDSHRRFEAGTIPEFNVLRAEVELARARPKLIRAHNRWATRKSELLTLLGVEGLENAGADIPVELTDTLQADFVPLPLSEALLQARETRPELDVLRSAIALQEQVVVQARAGHRPRLEVFGGYEARNSILTDRLSDEVHGWVAGAQVSWSLFDGALTRGHINEARARLAQAHTALDKQARQIDLEVRTAYSDCVEAQEVVASQNKAVEQATEALRQAVSRNQSGAATQLDVLAAQTALTDARTTQALALHGVAVAAVRLDYARGAILETAHEP